MISLARKLLDTSNMEEQIDPVDAACIALRDCLHQLSQAPTERELINTAQRLVNFLRNNGASTFTAGELNRIDIGLGLAESSLQL